MTSVTQGQLVHYRDADGSAWPAVVLRVKTSLAVIGPPGVERSFVPQRVDLLVLGLSHRAQLLGAGEQKRLIKQTNGSSDLVAVVDVDGSLPGEEVNGTWFE